MKSLDHWPDLGSDLDLCTLADSRYVQQVMWEEFRAAPVAPSWGDRLANKRNYRVPGLPELVEIHVQCLGQTGEHAELARRVIERRVSKAVGGRVFRVPASEERVAISVLQRVYRHFYFRLCDVIDLAPLLQSKTLDFAELKRSSTQSGIWPGVATFLVLVGNFVRSYGGIVAFPTDLVSSAFFQESELRFRDGFLRVPQKKAAALYVSQVLNAGWRRDIRALLRLPLLPPLAISALAAHKLSGNSAHIW